MESFIEDTKLIKEIQFKNDEELQKAIDNVVETVSAWEKQIDDAYKNIEYAKNVLSGLFNKKYGDQYKIIERPAKMGEKILVVANDIHGNYYRPGDVYTVLARNNGFVYIEKTFRFSDDNVGIPDHKYLVLEEIKESEKDDENDIPA